MRSSCLCGLTGPYTYTPRCTSSKDLMASLRWYLGFLEGQPGGAGMRDPIILDPCLVALTWGNFHIKDSRAIFRMDIGVLGKWF